MKTIGVLTSGGDCSGMNAAIKSIVEESSRHHIKVKGILEGYKGLIYDKVISLDYSRVAGIMQRGGTFIMSSRSPEFKTAEGFNKALETIKKEKIDGIIVIGGDGSLRGAQKLHNAGIKTIGIPGSIDNDIYGTNMSIGVDTSLNIITRSVDIIRDTASSHGRAFVIETMGRENGYLAAMGAMASGAEGVLIPEIGFDIDSISKRLKKEHDNGRMYSIIIVSEGTHKTEEMAEKLRTQAKLETRITILGHLQRGGSPTVFDRTLAIRMGTVAVGLLKSKKSGYMVGLSRSKMTHTTFDDVFSHKKELGPKIKAFVKRKSH